jgi:gliding motility-associated lipoprotein GldB
MRRVYFAVVCLSCLFAACESKKPDISNINLSVEIQRLDQDIFNNSVDSLRHKYGIFFDYYTEGVLNIGNYSDSAFLEYLNMFKTDSIVQKAYDDVNKQYPDLKKLTNKLTNAFKYYRYYFPDKYIPKVYTYISGFNQSFILTDSVLAIGLDKYLGADYDFYNKLQFHRYLSRNMYPEKIVSDYIETLIGNEWELNTRKNNDLISKMLYEGKILYATKMILPDETDSQIFGFTEDQIQWCKNNEQAMWVTLIENKLLFTTKQFMISKLTDVAPFTAEFTGESPGKACNWIGYNIITKYMKNNPQTSLQELMDNDDYHKIFEQAKYKP